MKKVLMEAKWGFVLAIWAKGDKKNGNFDWETWERIN